MSIFIKEKHIEPKYEYLDKYVKIMYKGMWTPAKYEKSIKELDAPYYFNSTNKVDQEAIKRCIMAVSMVEDKVKTFWNTLCLDIPQTIVGDVGGLFGQSEVTHRRSYHSLAEALKIDTDEIYEHDVIKDRVAYLTKHIETDPKIIGKKRILKKLVLFVALIEKISLFTQFYILMSYAYKNKGLKTISSLQQSTATEENVHYKFGIDLINIIKEEHPSLWEEYLIEAIEKNIKDAYDAEIKLIDWIFENGMPDHISKVEVLNFMNYNFNIVVQDLGLNLTYNYDSEMYVKSNQWFTIKTTAPVEPDFFVTSPGGYSSDDAELDIKSVFG